MSVEAFLGGLLQTSPRPFFKNGYGDYSYAVREAENTLSEYYKMEYLLS
jgi:hypothetical protein